MSTTETYKLNQVQAVLNKLLTSTFIQSWSNTETTSDRWKTRIKRLLEIDRAWGEKNKHRLREVPMAFYDELPGGTGNDSEFSPRKVFNLGLACSLLRMGFKQKETVEYIAIFDNDLKQAFEKVRPLTPVEFRAAPDIFLIVTAIEASSREEMATKGVVKAGENIPAGRVIEGGEELAKAVTRLSTAAMRAVGVICLSKTAYHLNGLLKKQEKKGRGRPGGLK